MFSGKSHRVKKVESCSLVWTGDREPIECMRDFFQRNGVRVSKVDRARGRISGRMGSWAGFDSCKVTAQLFPQTDVCLVVVSCLASRKTDADTLRAHLGKLKRNLDDVRLVDEHGFLDWKRRMAPVESTKGKEAGSIAISGDVKTGQR